MKYRIEIGGRGGEIVIGKVKREFYDFVEENEVDIEDYAWNFDFLEENEVDIPEDIRPFEPGDWYDCDNIAHQYGPGVDDAYVTITQDDEVLFENVEANELSQQGLTLEGGAEYYPNEELEDGDAYFIGQSFEKGHFLTFEFEADSFDLEKLTFHVVDVDGWELITSASYDGSAIEDMGDLSTSGKGSEFQLVLVEKD